MRSKANTQGQTIRQVTIPPSNCASRYVLVFFTFISGNESLRFLSRGAKIDEDMNQQKTLWIALLVTLGIAAVIVYFGFIKTDKAFFQAEWSQYNSARANLDTQLKQATAKIKHLQGQSFCSDDAQCRIIGLGTKSCGLYRDFLIYSVQDADESQLLPAVKAFNTLHEKMSDLSLNISRCGVAPAPIRCVRNLCSPVQSDTH